MDQMPPLPGFPFNDPNADIILRSSDNIDFRVHQIILSIASPVFRDMFALPRATNPSPTSTDLEKVVQMGESSTVLHDILRFWYPGAQPSIQSISQLSDIIQLTIGKYDMQMLVPMAQVFLTKYLTTDPLTVFAVAMRFGWEDSAHAAAQECLKLPLRSSSQTLSKEWNYAPGTAYHALIEYHFRCGEAVRAMVSASSSSWIVQLPPNKPASCCGLVWNGELFGRADWLTVFYGQYCEKLSQVPLGVVDRSWGFDNLVAPVDGYGVCHTCRSYPYRTVSDLIDRVWAPEAKAKIAQIPFKL
ncbi:hypothetical protein C8F01DRAFT_1022197 [Mycena amicta]|nr:hypothetical protein C8F01DRAFT_1022197 [Mycena amicta]